MSIPSIGGMRHSLGSTSPMSICMPGMFIGIGMGSWASADAASVASQRTARRGPKEEAERGPPRDLRGFFDIHSLSAGIEFVSVALVGPFPGRPQETGRWTPSGPLSQSWALELFGTPQSCPFQPSKPSILKSQKPVTPSLTTIRPSALRTSTPHAP